MSTETEEKPVELFKRFVEPGRLCVIEYGPDVGKLCFIADLISLNRVLVDGAGLTGVLRQSIPIRRLSLTDFRVRVNRGIRSVALKKEAEKQTVLDQFYQSGRGKKMVFRQRKASMTDFDRFKLSIVKQQRNRLARKHLKGLLKK